MKGRALVVLVAIALWMGLIVARLYQLQVVDHGAYLKRADRQQQRIVEIEPPRGTIYDAAGRTLAVSVGVDSAYAVPSQVKDPRRTARRLTAIVGGSATALARRLKLDREFVWVARKLDPPQTAAVRAMDLPGIYFLRESKRYYPMRDSAAQVLGYVGTDDQGLAGLELVYNRALSGRSVDRTVLRDARSGTVVDPQLSSVEAQPGADLRLTIDASIQHMAERELEATVERYRARSATAVVVDPNDGAILAMASVPGFDANRFSEYPPSAWRDRAIMDAYEPGSTFKMVTAAAALGANLFDPSDRINCEMGGITLASVRIKDHEPFGMLTFRQVIAKSSNVGAIKIGLTVGAQRLFDEVSAFGFGAPTGVDLPGESPGIVHPLREWKPLTVAYISFGQSISVTPLQLTMAYAAVANGGLLYRPYVVAEEGRDGDWMKREPREPVRRVIDAATARSLERLLEAVVEEGTGTRAAIPGYRVAGKTGTAQKAVAGEGYSPTKFVASFVGFAPARHPRIVCLVTVDEPHGSIYGGTVAAPAFRNIVEQALLYLGVPPEMDRAPQEPVRLAALRSSSPATETAPGTASHPVPAGDLPDFSGLSARQAVVRSSSLGLKVDLVGDGFVTRQSPIAGTPLQSIDGRLRLWLGSRREGAS